MPPPRVADLGAVADSVYAQELRDGLARLRFTHELEQTYVRLHLERARVQVRLWQSAAVVTSIFFAILRIERLGWWHPVSLLHLGLVVPAALVVAWAAWSSRYVEVYLPTARVVVPLIAIVAGVFGAQDASTGHSEVVAVLTAQMLCIFLMSGLLLRDATLAGVTLLVAFVTAAVWFGLAHLLLVQFVILLGSSAGIGIGARWGMERTERKSFLMEGIVAELAVRDALTGLWNRRAFDTHLRHVWAQGARERRPLAVIMFDVDHFKSINDRQGHQAGDRLLRRVAQCMGSLARRPLDMSARYGGDEFVALLYDVAQGQAASAAEQLRCAVADLRMEYGQPRVSAHVTVTIGVAVVVPRAERSADGVLQLADKALYNAKQAGRNCVQLVGQTEYDTVETGVFNSRELGFGG